MYVCIGIPSNAVNFLYQWIYHDLHVKRSSIWREYVKVYAKNAMDPSFDSLNALLETIPETCIVGFLREAGLFYLIWCNLLTSTGPQTLTIWWDLSNYLENESNSIHIYLCRTANMSWRMCVVVKQIQSNQPTAGSKCHTGMGNKEWVQVCSP